VIDDPDGRLAIQHNGIDLPYRTFDKWPQVDQAAIVENKRLGPILAYIAEKQEELDMSRSAKTAPPSRPKQPYVQIRGRSAGPSGAARKIKSQAHGKAAILLPTEGHL
jgi:hypothetical protein